MKSVAVTDGVRIRTRSGASDNLNDAKCAAPGANRQLLYTLFDPYQLLPESVQKSEKPHIYSALLRAASRFIESGSYPRRAVDRFVILPAVGSAAVFRRIE